MKQIACSLVCMAALLAASSAPAQKLTQGIQVPPAQKSLRPGEFVWEPERAKAGPVLLVVSKPEQMAYVYRNGIRIARSTVSTGKPGHETPTGVFTILGKEKEHASNLYKGAPMPFMERLTWTGIAMHAGNLPGYPASHGCIRLPMKFAELLYSVTSKGITVIIADEHSAPRETVHPGMVFHDPAKTAGPQPVPDGNGITWTPQKSPSGPVTILISGASRALVIFRNGVEIGRAPCQLGFPPGQHVYAALEGADPLGRRTWIRVDGRPAQHDPSFTDFARVGGIPAAFTAAVLKEITAGTTMIVTDLPVDHSTQSTPGFKVMHPGEVAQR